MPSGYSLVNASTGGLNQVRISGVACASTPGMSDSRNSHLLPSQKVLRWDNQLTQKLGDLHAPDDNATVETRWCQLRNIIQSTTLEVLGHARYQHQDRFDDNDTNISNLLAEKNQLPKAYRDFRADDNKAAYFKCRGHARNGRGRCRTPVTYGPCIEETAPLLSSDGTTLLAEKSQIMKHWAEHFISVLNCSSTISDAAIDRLPRVNTNNDQDLPPSLPETIRAVQQISSGKAPGSDAIPPEVYNHGGPRLMTELTTLFQEM
ncbi:unnamed protein product [Schistocephalus solidus]|uniref:Uncharacterized protein n=1 Tax=Schistocephalus solidus TaxID=70667 RepID=A0A3P7D8G6_SCHSO|nr:unnamed protein product [Schistocephalus solidus]